MAAMFVDHVGLLFFPEELLLRVIGRISFPIFAFLVAEGLEKTSNAWKYLLRLLIFAVLSQIPYSLFLQTSGLPPIRLNIFFTLSAGLIALMMLKKLRTAYALPGVVFIAVTAQYASFDYGVYGILTVLLSALFLRRRAAGFSALVGLPVLRAIAEFFSGFLSVQIYAALSAPLLMLYEGAYGRRLPRLLFYSFYPIHLLVLALVWLLFL